MNILDEHVPVNIFLLRAKEYYLVGVHIIAMLGAKGSAHSQVDHIAHNGK